MKFSFEGNQDDLQALVRSLSALTGASLPALRSPTSAMADTVTLGSSDLHPAMTGHMVDPVGEGMRTPGVSTGNHLTGAQGPSVPLEVASNPMEQPKMSGTNVPLDFFQNLKADPSAWAVWVGFIALWMENFQCDLDDEGKPVLPQPGRLSALKELGKGRWPLHILKWVSTYGSLQAAVFAALEEINYPGGRSGDPDKTSKDYQAALKLADDVSMTVVQVSHAAFPDLEGFYDHSTRWRRELSA